MCETQYNEFGLFRLMVAIAERARRDVEVDCEIYSGNQIEEITADMKHEAQEWLEDTGLAILDAYAPGYSPAGWQTQVKPGRVKKVVGTGQHLDQPQPYDKRLLDYTENKRVKQPGETRGERGRYYPAQQQTLFEGVQS